MSWTSSQRCKRLASATVSSTAIRAATPWQSGGSELSERAGRIRTWRLHCTAELGVACERGQ
eukprot:15443086-Alexandrium_andersonii.AAC.1